MRILHIENPAGIASQLASLQRSIGHTSEVLVTWPNSFGFSVDHELPYPGISMTTFRNMRKTVNIGRSCDVLHVHTGIAWKRLDILDLKIIRKRPMLVHYHGSETRQGYGAHYSSLADIAVVSTPDLLEWWPKARYIPNPADAALFDRPVKGPGEKVRLLHMPTKRSLKGTDKVLEAVQILREEGHQFDFDIVEGVDHDEAIRRIELADIIIDWVSDRKVTGIPGIYGKSTIEALSLGKASMAYIEPFLRNSYPADIPVIIPKAPTGPSVADALRPCIEDRAYLASLMARGRPYAIEHHDPIKILRRFEECYQRIV